MKTREFLNSLGACSEAVNQVAERHLYPAVHSSVRGDWLFWLASKMVGMPDGPTADDIADALRFAAAEFGIDAPGVSSALHKIRCQHAETFSADVVFMVNWLARKDGEIQADRLKRLAEISRERLSFEPLRELEP